MTSLGSDSNDSMTFPFRFWISLINIGSTLLPSFTKAEYAGETASIEDDNKINSLALGAGIRYNF